MFETRRSLKAESSFDHPRIKTRTLSSDSRRNESEKQKEIEEIQRRIAYLIATDQISEAQKIVIARNVLNIVEHGKKYQEGKVQ